MSTSTVTFAKSPTTVTVNGPTPCDVRLLPMFVTDQSANNQRWGYQTTDQKRWRWTLSLQALTDAMRDALEAFFTDTARGPLIEFTYTHTNEVAYLARFVDTELGWKRTSSDQWELTVAIETTTAPDGTETGPSTTTTSTTTTTGF